MRSPAKVILLSVVAILMVGIIPAAAADYTALGIDAGQDISLTVHRAEDGSVRKLFNDHRMPNTGTPSEIAGRFLADNALTLFDMEAVADKAGTVRFGDAILVDVRTTTTSSGHHVWKQATINGVPVHNGYVVTHLTFDGQVLFVTNDIGSSTFNLSADKATLDRETALDRAMSLIGGDGVTRAAPRAELVVLRAEDGDHQSWDVIGLCRRLKLQR